MGPRNRLLRLLIIFWKLNAIISLELESQNTELHIKRLSSSGANSRKPRVLAFEPRRYRIPSPNTMQNQFQLEPSNSDRMSKEIEIRIPENYQTRLLTTNGRKKLTSVARHLDGISDIEDKSFFMDQRDETSLITLLKTIIAQNLKKCDLVIIAESGFWTSRIIEALVTLPNLKQMLTIMQHSGDDMLPVSWISQRCQGILILTTNPKPLINFGNQQPSAWDYGSRVIVVGLAKEDLETFLQTKKAKKTEHILGIVKGDQVGIFRLFINELYWGKRGLLPMSTWRENSFTIRTNLFPDKISNLHQAALVVVVFELEPFIINRLDSDGRLIGRYGRDAEVYYSLADVFNFTIKELEPDPNEPFGVPLPNGSFNGMVGIIQRDEADLAVEDLWAIIDRTSIMDYSSPYSIDQGCFMARTEPPLSPWESPALPFQPLTWIIVFFGMICSGPVLYVLAIGSSKSDPKERVFHSFMKSSLSSYGIHFAQPMNKLPKYSSTQIFIAFLWVYSIVLTTGYKSNLTAFLTITREPKSMESLLELYKSARRVKGYDFFATQFDSSRLPHVRKLRENFESTICFGEAEKEVLEGKAVLIHSVVYLRFHIDKSTSTIDRPRFRIMKECLSQYHVIVAYQKNSPLKKKFDQAVTRIFESGLPRRWFLESIDKYRQIKREESDVKQEVQDEVHQEGGVVPLGMSHLQGVFIVWSFGFLTAATVFVAELTFGHRQI